MSSWDLVSSVPGLPLVLMVSLMMVSLDSRWPTSVSRSWIPLHYFCQVLSGHVICQYGLPIIGFLASSSNLFITLTAPCLSLQHLLDHFTFASPRTHCSLCFSVCAGLFNFANLAQLKSVWKERTLIEKMSPSDWPAGRWDTFSISDCCGRVHPIVGDGTPTAVVLNYVKKAS